MNDDLLKQVKDAVLGVTADAQIILYGSRSRKDAGPESDWDFLVLTDTVVDDDLIDTIRHRLYEIEWETGEILSVFVRNRSDWSRPPLQSMPFHANVETEGTGL